MSKRALVKDTLRPYFWELDLDLRPTILTTKKVKNGSDFKGGVSTFAKFEKDLKPLLYGSGGMLVTTLIDYYGSPTDFPGMNTRPNGSPIQRVEYVEAALLQEFGSPSNFIPFLMLHEFEALLFSSVDELPRVMTQMQNQPRFASVLDAFSSPEEINENPNTAPSKRIDSIFPSYRKGLHGPMIANRIGLEPMRAKCPHFAEWLGKLERYASS